ncbi:MAG: Yip1 family protein [Chromatocurvus sp.]
MIQHTIGLLLRPSAQWRAVAQLPEKSRNVLILYPCIFAILPAVAWYYGTSRVGWKTGLRGDVIRLTEDSALQISLLFYLIMVSSVAIIGYFIHWMSDTYGAESTIPKGIVIAGLTATPLFITGLVGFYPTLWIDLLIGLVAVSWSVYLMYLGIPIMMKIPEERGFLFSSAVLAIALVVMVCIIVISVMAWEYGAAPAFTDG